MPTCIVVTELVTGDLGFMATEPVVTHGTPGTIHTHLQPPLTESGSGVVCTRCDSQIAMATVSVNRVCPYN